MKVATLVVMACEYPTHDSDHVKEVERDRTFRSELLGKGSLLVVHDASS